MLRTVLLVVSPLIVIFGFVVVFGAPYLPSKKRNLTQLLKRLKLPKGSRIVDFGSGDGAALKLFAEHGLNASGVEANPLLLVFSKWRLRYHKNVFIVLGNMWNYNLSEDVDVVYVFLHPRFMKKLDDKLVNEAKPGTILISYAFKIPDKKPQLSEAGYFVYKY